LIRIAIHRTAYQFLFATVIEYASWWAWITTRKIWAAGELDILMACNCNILATERISEMACWTNIRALCADFVTDKPDAPIWTVWVVSAATYGTNVDIVEGRNSSGAHGQSGKKSCSETHFGLMIRRFVLMLELCI